MKNPCCKLYEITLVVVSTVMLNPVMAAEKSEVSPTLSMADSDVTANLIQTSLGLIVILALIAGAAWLVKRFGNFKVGAQGRMRIVGGLSVGTRERVVLLEIGDQQLLVGVAPGRIQTLHVLDERLPNESKSVESKGFAEKLSVAMNLARGKGS